MLAPRRVRTNPMAKSSLAHATWSPAKGLVMTAPAVVTLVGYGILILIVMLPVDMYNYDDKTGNYVKQKYSFWYRFLIALLLILPFALSIYSVNCMMTGNCTLWSWVVALLTLLWSVVIVVTTLSSGSFALDQIVN